MLIDKTILEMTLPEQVPQWFDISFVPDPRYKQPPLDIEQRAYGRRSSEPQCRANLLVHKTAPRYAQMVECAQHGNVDPLDWKWDEQGRGIWVSMGWYR